MNQDFKPRNFEVGDRVFKMGGDYTFKGEIRSVFPKKSGVLRAVVENDDGILHIYNLTQLMKE